MKNKRKIILTSIISALVILAIFVGISFSPLWLGVDLSQKISNIFCPPNYATEQNGWNLILVNEQNYLPRNYSVQLIEVEDGHKVDSRIYDPLKKMLKAAEQDGVYMEVVSGYRTEQKQQSIMNERILLYMANGHRYFKAKKLAESYVAQVGASEHQTGLAVDINQDLARSSGDEVYDWLYENAHNFGFVKRYPHDKTKITGISNEPWHYRYVGIDAAVEMKENNLCLEEFIETLK